MTWRVVRAVLRPCRLDTPAEVANTGLRVCYGVLVFVIHGWHKAADAAGHFAGGGPWPLADEIRAMGLPMPGVHAAFATVVQLVAPVLILVGLTTRPAAGLLACVLCGAVAQNLHAGRDPQLAVLYTIVALTLCVWGSGRVSLDAAIWGRQACPG